MKKYLALSLLALTGCATSPNGIKDHNLLNAYNSQKSANEVVQIAEAMSEYCAGGLYQPVVESMPSIGKARMSLKVRNSSSYYFLVDAEDLPNGGSFVGVYHYSDTPITKMMGKAVQDWTERSSRECVQGF